MADLPEEIRTVKTLQGQILQRDQTLTVADVDNERVFQSGSGEIHLDIGSQTYKITVADIQASVEPLNENIFYKTQVNGIISEWVVDPSDTTSADDGYNVLVTAGGQRLKKRFQTIINVCEFGAIGDGVVTADPLVATGTDNTPYINAATQFLANQRQGVSDMGQQQTTYTLYFPKGVYVISDEILIDRFISIVGDDAIIFQNNPEAKIFNFFAAYSNNVSRIRFRNGTNQIYLTNVNTDRTRINIDDCWFSNASDYAINTLGTGAADDHMSCILSINRPQFWRTPKCVYSVCDNTNITDLWLTMLMTADTAPIVNRLGVMTVDRGIGVGQFGPRPSNIRWFDNYTGLTVRNFKFGAEGDGDTGFVPVYNFGSTEPDTNAVGFNNVILDNCLMRMQVGAAFNEPIGAVVCKDLPASIKLINNRDMLFIKNGVHQPLIDTSAIDLPTVLASKVHYRDYATYVVENNTGTPQVLKWKSMPNELLPYSNWSEYYFKTVIDTFLTNLGFRDRNILVDTAARPNSTVAVRPISDDRNKVFIKKISPDNNNVIVTVQGGGTIDGLSSVTITHEGDFIELTPGDNEYHITDSRISSAINNIVTVSGNKTLALTDSQTFQNVTAAATITIPTHGAVAFPIGTEIEFFQASEGVITFAFSGGMVVIGDSLSTGSVGDAAKLKKTGNNTWDLIIVGATEPTQAVIPGTEINMTDGADYRWKNISADTTFSFISPKDARPIVIDVFNTGAAPVLATFTGLTFPGSGGAAEIPVGGSIRVRVERINGVMHGEVDTFYLMGDTEVTGTVIDSSLSSTRNYYANISASTTYTLSNFAGSDHLQFLVRNTGAAVITVAITGIAFPTGSTNSIQPGGKAVISLNRINAEASASIVVYDAP